MLSSLPLRSSISGMHVELCVPLVPFPHPPAPSSQTNFLRRGTLFAWQCGYREHETEPASIINRRLKQLYGTLKPPRRPTLAYGPALQAALDHLNYGKNRPSPAGLISITQLSPWRAPKSWSLTPPPPIRITHTLACTRTPEDSVQVRVERLSRVEYIVNVKSEDMR